MLNSPCATHDEPSSLIVDYGDAPEIYHEAPQQVPQAPQAHYTWSAPPEKNHPTEQNASTENDQPFGKSSRICGAQRQTFWLVMILLIVVLAASVGGGVGGSLAVENAKHERSNAVSTTQLSASPTPISLGTSTTSASASTSSSSPSAYVPTPPGDVLRVGSTCPAFGTITMTVRGNMRTNSYNCSQQTNYPENDISMLTAYTMEQCIEACIILNVFQNNRTCVGVAHSPLMSYRYETGGGNCFLKSNTGTVQRVESPEFWNFARLITT